MAPATAQYRGKGRSITRDALALKLSEVLDELDVEYEVMTREDADGWHYTFHLCVPDAVRGRGATQDVRVMNEGTLILLELESSEAQMWAEDHLPDAHYIPRQVHPTAAVERQYAEDVIKRMEADGLTVRR